MSPVTPGHDDHTTDTPIRCQASISGECLALTEGDRLCPLGTCDRIPIDPSRVVGGHGTHGDTPAADTGAHWTVDEDGELKLDDDFVLVTLSTSGNTILTDEEYAALVQHVRDARRVPALQADAAVLAQARRMAALTQEAADTEDYAAYDLGIGSLLDLLTGETDG